jgi:hypothetical protein
MADCQPTALESSVQSLEASIPVRRRASALYMRISTKGHGQTIDTQALALQEYAERRGFQVVEYRDEGVSGIKDRRPVLVCDQIRISLFSSGVVMHRSKKPNRPSSLTSSAASMKPVIAAR